MLYYSIVFFIIALVAAVLGFGGLAGTMAGIAQVLFWIFVVLFVISLILGAEAGPENPEVLSGQLWIAASTRP